MKTLVYLIISMLFVNMLSGIVVVTSDIDIETFASAMDENAVWYAQLQPGGTGTTDPDNEFELGGSGNISNVTAYMGDIYYDLDPYYEGNTSILDKADNSFVISVSESNFLSVTFNGIGTAEGNQLGVVPDFNTIWVGLYYETQLFPSDSVEVNSQQLEVDTIAVLPDMLIDEDNGWMAFKFHLDDKVDNIGAIEITGNIYPDMFLGGSGDEDWTYTVFATHEVIPEPSTYAFIIGGLILMLAMCKRKS